MRGGLSEADLRRLDQLDATGGLEPNGLRPGLVGRLAMAGPPRSRQGDSALLCRGCGRMAASGMVPRWARERGMGNRRRGLCPPALCLSQIPFRAQLRGGGRGGDRWDSRGQPSSGGASGAVIGAASERPRARGSGLQQSHNRSQGRQERRVCLGWPWGRERGTTGRSL
jgi:hypothetical protein